MADKRETRDSDAAEDVPSSEEDVAGSEENVNPVPSKTLPRAGNLASKRAMLSAAAGINIPNTKKDNDPYFMRHTKQSDKKKMFEQQVDEHKKKMSANPFSDSYKTSAQNIPHKDDPNYGRPPPGSKTEMRGKKAAAHINNEVVLLCNMIYQEGERYPDHTAAISFGELFQIYTRISNKVVGVLLRARKHGLVFFEGEVLFQRRDDDVPILLAKPIEEIRAEMRQDREFDVGICHQTAEKKTEENKSASENRPSVNSNIDIDKAEKASVNETTSGDQLSLPTADAVFSPSSSHSPAVEPHPVIQNSMKIALPSSSAPLLVSH